MGFMEYIRKLGYPKAKRGQRVQTRLGEGTITSADQSAHIMVRIQRQKRPLPFHPGDVKYL